MRPALALCSFAMLLHSSAVSATEWLSCANADYGFEVLVGGSNEKTGIEDFSFYRWNTVPDSSKLWSLRKAEIDLRQQTVRLEAMARSKDRPDLVLTIKGTKGTLKIGENKVETECDWSNLDAEAQQGAPADAPASREFPRAFGPRRG